MLTACTVTDSMTSQSPGKPVFDVPALLGQDIDQVRTTLLGKTQGRDDDPNSRQYQGGPTEWVKSFQRDSTTLMVTFNSGTRQVRDFFIKTAHGSTANYSGLLRLANVTENDPRLRIEPIKSLAAPQLYTGVRIAAK
jgi:hypothetical protein